MLAERIVYDTVYSTSENVRAGRANKAQTLEELVTLWAETTGNIDAYYFETKNGLVISPNDQKPIIDSIKKDTPIDRAEFEFFQKFEDWAVNGTQKNTVWASYTHPSRSENCKFIISTREGDKILNRSIRVNLDRLEFLHLSNDLIRHSIDPEQNIFDPESLRSELLIIRDDIDWIQILEKHLGKGELFTQIRNDDDLLHRQGHLDRAAIYYDMMQRGVPAEEIAARMRQDNFVGDQSPTCPPGMRTASELMTANSIVYSGVEDQYGSLTFKCQKGHTNTRPYGQLAKHCQTCGEDVSCGKTA